MFFTFQPMHHCYFGKSSLLLGAAWLSVIVVQVVSLESCLLALGAEDRKEIVLVYRGLNFPLVALPSS